MSRGLVLVSLPVVLAAGAAAVGWQQYQGFLNAPVMVDANYVLTVPKGSSFNTVVGALVSDGVIDRPLFMKAYGRQSGLAPKIRAGEYKIAQGTTPKGLVDVLVSGKSIQYSFTIIEGSTAKDLLAQLRQNPVLVQTLQDKSADDVKTALKVEHPSLEGLFLAETYNFERGATDLDILKRSQRLLNQKLQAAWMERPKALPYKSAYEALTMASIVEKETARPDERPEIAGVFVRRLNKGMRLQTDPTVIYGMGDKYKGNIRRSDLRRPTPYNTYVIKGLPPTPIALVGEEAIVAALNPKAGKSLYFVAKGDGSHQFSNTLKEHNNAVRRYQLKRRKDYRSTP